MQQFLIDVIAVAVVLGFMILIHEFGHYAAAKLLGVRVEQFAIGFGKRLFGFKRGDTDYRINALPLGGYVKMSGENPMDARTGDSAEFLSHPRWHRFIIAIAGPFMNVALAIGLLAGVYMVHYEYPVFLDKPAVIAWVKHDSAADKAGLKPGDRIVRIDDVENPTWEQVEPKVWLSPNHPLDVVVQRGNQTIDTTIVPKTAPKTEVGAAGWYPDGSIIVGDLDPDMPAAKAGIREDDQIVALDGRKLGSIDDMIDSLQQSKDQPINLTVLRHGQPMDFRVTPVLTNTEEQGEKRYRIGFAAKVQTKVGRLSFIPAMQRSLEDNKKNSLLILELVEKIVRGEISPKTVSGPIGIAQDAGEAATEKGWTPLILLTAGISLNLGIFNLLPIPILDGGVILLLAIESFMRRDISLRIKERIYQAAFVFLVLFAVMVIYNDLAKTIPGLTGSLP